MKTVKEFLSKDKLRKVRIFRRGDGSFGFEALRFSDDPLEMSWIPDGSYSECFAPDAQTAEKQAKQRVRWLRDG